MLTRPVLLYEQILLANFGHFVSGHLWAPALVLDFEFSGHQAGMCAQVLALAHQLNPAVLRRGAGEALWDELRFLLDMQPAEPPTLDSVSAQVSKLCFSLLLHFFIRMRQEGGFMTGMRRLNKRLGQAFCVPHCDAQVSVICCVRHFSSLRALVL